MKKTLLIISFLLLNASFFILNAQVGINTDNSSPDASAMLDIKSTDKGMLIPRMTTAQRNAIASPATGLLVFDNTSSSFWFFNGSTWEDLSGETIPDRIADADNNTKIQVEENPNEDIIRFDLAGTEYFKMEGKHLEFLNSGRSVFIGEAAGASDDSAIKNNTFVGYNTAISTTSGSQNTALGSLALEDNSTGGNNTAIGAQALDNNTTGNGNTALGKSANVTSGNLSNATAIGYQSRVSTSNSLALGGTGSYAVNVGIGTSSPTELLTLAGTSGTDGILFPDNTLQTTAFTGSVVVDEIADADQNTKIQVEESPNEDIIRFDLAGTEQWKMLGTRLEPVNTSNSVFIGKNAGLNDDLTEKRNVFIGYDAGAANTTGYANTATGQSALNANISGSGNTATGSAALKYNTLGEYNTAIGDVALIGNTTGNGNTAIGSTSLSGNTTGNSNTGLGKNALAINNTGSRNVAVGFGSMGINTSGNNNTALGYSSGVSSADLTNTTAIGYNAKVAANNSFVLGGTGSDAVNVGIGTDAPTELLTLAGISGTDGILFPDNTLQTTAFTGSVVVDEIADADQNTKIQVEESPNEDIIRFDMAGTEKWVFKGSRIEPTNSGNTIAIGINAGANDDLNSNNNVFLGYKSGKLTTSGANNIGIGYCTLSTNVTGGGNIAIGRLTQTDRQSGQFNTSVGTNSFEKNVTGGGNTVIGASSFLNNINGTGNVGLGNRAGQNNDGSYNVFIGNQSGENFTGSNLLSIENSSTLTPLIYGEFDNDLLRVNGTLNINNAFSFPTIDGTANQVLQTDGNGNLTWANAATDTDDQTLSLSGNNLTIADGNTVDLSGIDTDDQTLSFSGNNLVIADGNSVDLSTVAIVNTTPDNAEVGGQTASIDISGKLEVSQTVKTFGNVELATKPGSTTTIGSSGSAINYIIKVDVSKNVGSISSDDQLNVDFSVPGAETGSSVMVSPSADLPNQVFIGQARVQSNGVVRVRFQNESNSSKDPASMTYYITVIK